MDTESDNQLNPILVKRYRGGVLESFHRGVVCMMNEQKEIIFSLGNIDQLCFPRSALKLFQVIPLIESGAVEHFGFTLQEISVMCGSHNGEERHIEVVNSILAKIGLQECDLRCGCQQPTLSQDRTSLILTGGAPTQLHNNCSGKHAGFLALCVYRGWPIETYTAIDHPLQQEILATVAEMHEISADDLHIAMDGCSAPIFSLTVKQQALGWHNLIRPAAFGERREKSCKTIVEAITCFPYMVAGESRYCTEMMAACGSRIVGKTGADGIYCLGFPEAGISCAIKVDDGLTGPQYNIAQEIIKVLKAGPELALTQLEKYISGPILNWNKYTVGEEKVSEELFEPLANFAFN